MSSAANELSRLRAFRVRPDRDQTIATILTRTSSQLTQAQRRMGGLIALWEQVVPAELSRQTALISMSRGVLLVAVDSSSAMFQLDRELRGGLTDAMRTGYRGTLTRIKLRLRDTPASHPASAAPPTGARQSRPRGRRARG